MASLRIVVCAALLAACGSDGGVGVDGGLDSGTKPDGSPVDASQVVDAQPDVVADAGYDGPIPIKHVVVIVKENHTFDNYFGSFPGAEGTTTAVTAHGVVPVKEAPDKTPRDLCHAHDCALTDWNGGKMDNWDAVTG